MSSQLQKQLQALAQPHALEQLVDIQRGIEKESLRITPDGRLAQTPHPKALGSALTHNSITTDYSEALLEFITPVSNSIEGSLTTLEDIHKFVYRNIGDERLWAASMPCIVTGDDSIPVALYGSSNVARMKTVYRYGLGHRYGRLMQAISGIHYNFSMPASFWQRSWKEDGNPGELQDYISERYLGLIRNFRRYSWLLIYLFGASPAVCSSFLRGRDTHDLQAFDAEGKSLYLPHGTALRMGDLGYNSDAQKDLSVCYNSLQNYIDTLSEAIKQPHPSYSDIPAGQNGDYQQLNDSLLQIENEFYSAIRPKRVANSGESALNALARGGIEYIEVRCVDVSPFAPVGLDAQQIRFIDTFLLYCLLDESPDCDADEQTEQTTNLEAVVNRGRQPNLQLAKHGQQLSLANWAGDLLDAMAPIAKLLDQAHDSDGKSTNYSTSLSEQQAKVDDSEKTPSARILREMQEKNLPFFRLAMAYSEQWADALREQPISPAGQASFEEETKRSLQAQRELEEEPDTNFEDYLAMYYQQYEAL